MATKDEDLEHVIAESLNKGKDGKLAYFIGEEETPTDLTDFVSMGSAIGDLAISNRPHGGLAVGRLTELTGLEHSGKSLIAAHVLANTQKAGGVAVLIDTENAVNEEFFRAVGLDMQKLVYLPLTTVEEIFAAIEKIIESVRKSTKDRLVTIVVDSVAGASTEAEMASDYGKDGYATGKAIIISKALRKITNMIGKQRVMLIFTNQLRQKLNAVAFGDQFTTSGGKSVAFHSSTRLRLSQVSKLKNTAGEIIGVTVKMQVVKNRLGPPYRVAEFNVYFDRGIDDIGSWMKVMKDKNIVSGTTSVTYKAISGEEFKFVPKKFKSFLDEHPDLQEEIYLRICDAVIMSYKSGENIEVITDESIDE